ncbi:hypothetical protein ACGFI4_14040 [Micromonospora carbonacea]|uniref:Uncharacterized protein n=1 Tax=Micromonospora carbonacea TaxID=47853 RepID=A0A1C4Y6D4_9ACTN|nr:MULTISPECIES: hypothetical protein [Micromonospora]MBB5825190.1 hypothetical protein [Micromonospora carbonacea]MDG4814546.1 hypothetical protein [Micromonospora sp. WMMD956]QLD26719.1 hypothetical protein HXZ27_22960 [Micromonospora carbonacea]WFE57210.1 hypothetical protein O7633_10140 [Micromonospora sp. WMMD712]SCF16279.1 hypothetical protein GA0070563_105397 [Micromonospora carbonacea]
MHVRLSAAWTDPRGTLWAPGDTVDVDAVTLAALEEQGMVDTPDGQGTAPDQGSTKTTTTKPTDPSKIGPGPSAPPADEPGK